MGCYNGKGFVLWAILCIILQTINSAPVSDGYGTNPNDLNGKKLIEIGKILNLPKLQMIGKTIENVANEIEAKIEEKLEAKIEQIVKAKVCDMHPCSDWKKWSDCTARVGQFGSKFRTRRCSINVTTCETDSNSTAKEKVEKEFGICIGYCPDGYNFTKNGFCLKFNADRKLKQADAEKQCQKDGGHLVNIDSEVKFEDVSSVVTGFTTKRGIWVDGRRKDVSSQWKYSYGSQKGFTSKWYSSEPSNASNELCLLVTLYSDGLKWYDSKCDFHCHFICEIIKNL